MAEKKDNNKTKKPKTNNKSKTVLEVNEITEETIKADEEKRVEAEKRAKEKAERIRKEKIEKTFRKVLKGYDIKNIARILMWAFFFIAAMYVNINIFRQSFSAPALKVFIKEESLKETISYKVDKIDELNIKLDSFDVHIKESDTDDIVIRYSKKYDKKININKKSRSIIVEERKKIFKLVRFDSSNNVMIFEIPKQYEGSLEVESKTGTIKMEKYKMQTVEEIEDDQVDDFYKNFFNI